MISVCALCSAPACSLLTVLDADTSPGSTNACFSGSETGCESSQSPLQSTHPLTYTHTHLFRGPSLLFLLPFLSCLQILQAVQLDRQPVAPSVAS